MTSYPSAGRLFPHGRGGEHVQQDSLLRSSLAGLFKGLVALLYTLLLYGHVNHHQYSCTKAWHYLDSPFELVASRFGRRKTRFGSAWLLLCRPKE